MLNKNGYSLVVKKTKKNNNKKTNATGKLARSVKMAYTEEFYQVWVFELLYY
jgi:hypothetical protein